MRPGWFALVVATLVAILAFALLVGDALQTSRRPSAYAASRGPDPAGRPYQNGNTNDNADDGGDGDLDNGEADNDESDNDEADNDEADNDEADVDIGLDLPPPISSTRQPEPTCSAPGQDTVFTSFDRKVTVRVPGSSPRPVRVAIYLVLNPHEAPAPPGTFVDPLVYEIKASHCDAAPLEAFPAEVALAIRYTDLEAAGLDEGRFEIGRLDMTTGSWVPVERGLNDPMSNVVAATIPETGFYMVWQAR